MKSRLWIALALVSCAGVLMAQGVTLQSGQIVAYKFIAKTLAFSRPDGRVLTVMIDDNGTLTLLDDRELLGQQSGACAVAE